MSNWLGHFIISMFLHGELNLFYDLIILQSMTLLDITKL